MWFVYTVRLYWTKWIFPFFSGQFEVASGLRKGDHDYFFWVLDPSMNLCRPCTSNHSLRVHMCASPVVSRRHCFFGVFHPHQLLQSFLLLFHKFPWATRKGFLSILQFMTGCFKISQPMYMVQLWASVFVSIDFRRKLLQWWLIKTLINGYNVM